MLTYGKVPARVPSMILLPGVVSVRTATNSKTLEGRSTLMTAKDVEA